MFNLIFSVSLFTMVNIKNSECLGNTGICYTGIECVANGGTKSGTCAQGLGTCCVSKFFFILNILS